MTLPLLENELVQKYFRHNSQRTMALRVLTAMQEPIKKGEAFLHIMSHDDIVECSTDRDMPNLDKFHPHHLRFLDCFQPRRDAECDIKGHPCDHCGKAEEFHTPKTLPPPVEKCEQGLCPGGCVSVNTFRNVNARNPPELSTEVEEKINQLCSQTRVYPSDLKYLLSLARKSRGEA